LRYLDLALAALIGISTVAAISWYSTGPADATSSELALRVRLRDSLLSLLQEKGVRWFLVTPPDEICSSLAAISNSSETFSATVGTLSCRIPPKDSVDETMSLPFLPQVVTLECWSAVGA
jgi:hypothetical protein